MSAATVAAPGTGSRLLGPAIVISLAVHALVLAIRFVDPGGLWRERADPRLEIVLVNAKGEQRPRTPQALAQANLDGGGNSDSGRRSSPLPPVAAARGAQTAENLRQEVRELEREQRELLATNRASQDALLSALRAPDPERPAELRREQQELARMEAEIAREVSDYQKRPRVHRFMPSTSAYRFARYFEDWRTRVERIGNQHYPEDARGRIYGTVRMTVVIDRDGALVDAIVEESSGSAVLDAAAQRIVKLAAPFPPFPPDLARDTDRLEITRSWIFTNDQLALQAPEGGADR